MIPYILLFVIVTFLAIKGRRNKAARITLFIVMTLFVGLRKDVGTDYEEYSRLFVFQEDYLEAGFSYILLALNRYGLSVSYFFFTIAAISYLFMFMAVEKTPIFRKTSVLITLPLLSMSFLCNGIRQGVAICVFLYAYHFILERKPVQYLLCIAFAFLFHKSIIITLPLYFLQERHLSQKLYYLIYGASFIFCVLDLNTIMEPFTSIIETNRRYSNLLSADEGSGYFSLGVLLEMSNYVLIIYLATKRELFKQQPLLYNLVLIAAVLMNMRVGAPLMNRVLTTFAWFCYPMIPLILKNTPKKTRSLVALFFILTYTLSTVKYIFFDDKSMLYPYHDALGIF